MQIRRRFARNAIANLGRGSAGAVVALLLPPVLIRHMPPASYAAWVLVLQVVAYVGYLDFGLQTAVGRYIAFANEKKDENWRDGIFSSALLGLLLAAILGVLLLLAAAACAPRMFPNVPSTLIEPMRRALVIVGVSVALGLPASAWNGVFVGLQRFEIPAITGGGARVISALGLIWAALTGRSIVFMAVVVAVVNVLSYALQYGILRRVAADIHFKAALVTRQVIRELSGYCFSLTVWSLAMLVITGLDLLLVGRFQFEAVVPYSVAATLITFLGGVQNAIFGVIMPHAAELHARQSSAALGSLLVKTTKLGVLLLLLTGLPLIAFAAPLLRLWIGAQFAHSGGRILTVLVIANMIRLTGIPLASILIGTGHQRLLILTPIVEAFTNLTFSIGLGIKYGAIGVAWGTLIGGVVAVTANICYNLPRVRDGIECSPFRYFSEAMVVPMFCGIPFLLAVLASMVFPSMNTGILASGAFVSVCICGFSILQTGTKHARSGWAAGGDSEKE